MEQIEIIIKNNDLNIMLFNRNTNERKIINANELLQKENVYDFVDFYKFEKNYFYIVEQLKQAPKTACDLIMNNTLSFNRRIPLNHINNIYGLKLESSNKEIQKAVSNYINNKREYVYYCDDKTDKYVAILYHYLTNGYYLRKCINCGNFYLKNKNQSKYCDKCKLIREEETRHKKNEDQKKIGQEMYTKKINATRGLLSNNQDKIPNYEDIKIKFDNLVSKKRKEFKLGKISKEEFNLWSIETHKEYKELITKIKKERN